MSLLFLFIFLQLNGILINPHNKPSLTLTLTLSANGIVADPNKVKAITEMPIPNDSSAVRRFCGMINYLSRYLPNLSSV